MLIALLAAAAAGYYFWQQEQKRRHGSGHHHVPHDDHGWYEPPPPPQHVYRRPMGALCAVCDQPATIAAVVDQYPALCAACFDRYRPGPDNPMRVEEVVSAPAPEHDPYYHYRRRRDSSWG